MSDLWVTPQALFDKLHAEFDFVLDVCALPENRKCREFLTPQMDALGIDWAWWAKGRACWMNPPYGRTIGLWMKKASETDAIVVCLIPNRSNAPWWHDYVMKAKEIRFIKHKVSFGGEADGVPFWGSVIVVFDPSQVSDSPRVSSYIQPKHEGEKCKSGQSLLGTTFGSADSGINESGGFTCFPSLVSVS